MVRGYERPKVKTFEPAFAFIVGLEFASLNLNQSSSAAGESLALPSSAAYLYNFISHGYDERFIAK